MAGRLMDYNGDRSARSLRDWGLALLPNAVATINRPAQLTELLKYAPPPPLPLLPSSPLSSSLFFSLLLLFYYFFPILTSVSGREPTLFSLQTCLGYSCMVADGILRLIVCITRDLAVVPHTGSHLCTAECLMPSKVPSCVKSCDACTIKELPGKAFRTLAVILSSRGQIPLH